MVEQSRLGEGIEIQTRLEALSLCQIKGSWYTVDLTMQMNIEDRGTTPWIVRSLPSKLFGPERP